MAPASKQVTLSHLVLPRSLTIVDSHAGLQLTTIVNFVCAGKSKMVFPRGGKTGPPLQDDEMEFSDPEERPTTTQHMHLQTTNNVLLDVLAEKVLELKLQEELQVQKDKKIAELEKEVDLKRALAESQTKVGRLEEVVERLTKENEMLKKGQGHPCVE
ncbi:hypothetical protein BDP27DRAFT_1430489 [Rhodocollybia butyracea]|uniref:Uncharacterized protein n=1 Tax=Rhodocollybia butyracea TaxID=206335 RepID=A0A9P5TZB3_9AGAR|nr:hypothetical protein BDP27DRAFT_1430489 [Rhodocollybia butyracea]